MRLDAALGVACLLTAAALPGQELPDPAEARVPKAPVPMEGARRAAGEFPRAASGGTLFRDRAPALGLDRFLTATWGAAWSDADGDGRPDLLLGRHRDAPPTLFLQRGHGFLALDDILSTEIRDRHGPSFADFDSDGDADLLLTTGGGIAGATGVPAEFFRNEGSRGREVAAELGIDAPTCRGRGAAWFDPDGDGDLDLLLLCGDSRVGARTTLYENRGPEGFVDVGASRGLEFNLAFNGGAFPADYDDDGDLDLLLTAATVPARDRSLLLRNDGGVFTDVTLAAGLGLLHGGRGAAWADLDNDGDLDLYLGRGENLRGNGADGWTLDPARPQELAFLLNTGGRDGLDVLTFTSSGERLRFLFPEVPPFVRALEPGEVFLGPEGVPAAGQPVLLGPEDEALLQGSPEVDPRLRRGVSIWKEGEVWFVAVSPGGGESPEPFLGSALVSSDGPFLLVSAELLESPIGDGLDRANRLYRNDGDGTFTEVADEAGVAGDPLHNTGPVVAGDFDNDGDLDLFALNGDHVVPEPRPFLAFRNDGGLRFTDVSGFLGLPRRALSRKATAVKADYDSDGRLDLWISNEIGPAPYTTGPYLLLRNRGTGRAGLTLELVGTESNRDAIGARAYLTARIGGRLRTQVRQAAGGYQLYSQDDPRLHFGLADADGITRLEIHWPSGTTQTLTDLPLTPHLQITEPAGVRHRTPR